MSTDKEFDHDREDWVKFFRNGIETIEGQRYEIKKLNERIEALEEGECRFHCRMRADMWKAGFKWAWDGANVTDPKFDADPNQEYKEWSKNERNT
jgi:hypothetical protein